MDLYDSVKHVEKKTERNEKKNNKRFSEASNSWPKRTLNLVKKEMIKKKKVLYTKRSEKTPFQ